jgi:transcriptional regulator with PAS, ATPase and Fis domain
MAVRPFSPQRAARRIEPEKLEAHPLMALQSIRELRDYLREAEIRAIERSLELGAEKEEIAETLGVTRQGVDYKLKSRSAEVAAVE